MENKRSSGQSECARKYSINNNEISDTNVFMTSTIPFQLTIPIGWSTWIDLGKWLTFLNNIAGPCDTVSRKRHLNSRELKRTGWRKNSEVGSLWSSDRHYCHPIDLGKWPTFLNKTLQVLEKQFPERDTWYGARWKKRVEEKIEKLVN